MASLGLFGSISPRPRHARGSVERPGLAGGGRATRDLCLGRSVKKQGAWSGKRGPVRAVVGEPYETSPRKEHQKRSKGGDIGPWRRCHLSLCLYLSMRIPSFFNVPPMPSARGVRRPPEAPHGKRGRSNSWHSSSEALAQASQRASGQASSASAGRWTQRPGRGMDSASESLSFDVARQTKHRKITQGRP